MHKAALYGIALVTAETKNMFHRQAFCMGKQNLAAAFLKKRKNKETLYTTCMGLQPIKRGSQLKQGKGKTSITKMYISVKNGSRLKAFLKTWESGQADAQLIE